RMGHVELATTVAHPLYFRKTSILARLLDLKPENVEKVVYHECRVVVDPGYPGDTRLKQGQLLTEEDHRRARELYGDLFDADSGAEGIGRLPDRVDLAGLAAELRGRLDRERERDSPSRQKLRALSRRLHLVEALRNNGTHTHPRWTLLLECLPVIPPGLRPLDGDGPDDDLNDLYRRVVSRNRRLIALVDLNAPEVIIR